VGFDDGHLLLAREVPTTSLTGTVVGYCHGIVPLWGVELTAKRENSTSA
jgi:hypothetical protein